MSQKIHLKWLIAVVTEDRVVASLAKDQKTPPPVKCRRFMHFRNLKHRNLSWLILRQSITPHTTASPAAIPRLDFGVSPNCASRLWELTAQDGVAGGMVSG
jgi:hypothetical protein